METSARMPVACTPRMRRSPVSASRWSTASRTLEFARLDWHELISSRQVSIREEHESPLTEHVGAYCFILTPLGSSPKTWRGCPTRSFLLGRPQFPPGHRADARAP